MIILLYDRLLIIYIKISVVCMYAVLQNGGKQYKVSVGEVIRLEKINLPIGNFFDITQILMIINDDVVIFGSPFISNVIITVKIIAHIRNSKIKIIKFRRRKHSRKKSGHRQWCTDVEVISISNSN